MPSAKTALLATSRPSLYPPAPPRPPSSPPSPGPPWSSRCTPLWTSSRRSRCGPTCCGRVRARDTLAACRRCRAPLPMPEHVGMLQCCVSACSRPTSLAPPAPPAGVLPCVAAAWSLLYYRLRRAPRAALQGAPRPARQASASPGTRSPTPETLHPSAHLAPTRFPHPRLPRRWAHRVALRYRASLGGGKQPVVHKFFDELEVEVGAGWLGGGWGGGDGTGYLGSAGGLGTRFSNS